MKDLIKDLREFASERDWEQFHSPKNLAMALSVEVAEIVEIFQWLTQEESRNLDFKKRERVKEEIGDVLIFLANLAEKLGIDPVKAAKEKLKMNRKKYPAELVKGKANKYTEYE
jgi:NTP pyrophosphatase (non-canonical NTP hydrolase)